MHRRLLYLLISIAALLTGVETAYAQKYTLSGSKSLDKPETLTYDLNFKWGLVRGKVGEAVLTNKPISSGSQYFSQVRFRTTGIGNLVFPTRDTLETLYSSQGLPLRYEHRGKDKGKSSNEEVTFTYLDESVRAKVRYTWDGQTKSDTTHLLPRGGSYILDLVSTMALVRSIDPYHINKNTGYKITIPNGNDIIYGDVHFVGYDKAKLPNGKEVKAIRLILNIHDKAFDSNKESVVVLLSRDERLLPLIIRAKLKIGYVECELKDYHSNSR